MPPLTLISGNNAECVTNGIDEAWDPLATWLRANGRQALNTETGGGNVDSCVSYISQQIAYQAQQSDGTFSPSPCPDKTRHVLSIVILGYIGWSAGSFATYYVLSQVPSYIGTGWNDTLLVSMAMSPKTNLLVVSVV
jgi:endoglucanase